MGVVEPLDPLEPLDLLETKENDNEKMVRHLTLETDNATMKRQRGAGGSRALSGGETRVEHLDPLDHHDHSFTFRR